MRNDIKVFAAYERFKDPCLNAKIYKVLSHYYDSDKWSIWIDGNIKLLVSERDMIDLAENNEVTVFANPYLDCIYKEAEFCAMHGLDDAETIKEQINRYRSDGYPENAGLAACYIIIRKHTSLVKRLNEKWWAEICHGSKRDQISFPYVFRNMIHYLPKVQNRNDIFIRTGYAR